MLEALTVTEISRRDLRADTSLVPAFQGLLSEASDRPERLQQQRFYLPLGAVLVAAFHNLPDPKKITSEALVGAALLNFDFDPHRYPQVCLLNGLAVRPDLQRQKTGIAESLLDASLIVAAEKGKSTLWATTPKRKPWLQEYYIQQHGFRRARFLTRLTISNRLLEKDVPLLDTIAGKSNDTPCIS